MSLKEENEITLRVIGSNEDLIKSLKDQNFKEGRKFTLDDYYLVPNDLDLSNLSIREILSKAIIIRYIVNDGKIIQKITFKIKNIDSEGKILEQKAINCDIQSIEEARNLFKAIGYNEIMNIKESDIVYYNGKFELAVKFIENSDTLIEIETDENYDTIDKLINKVKEINLPIEENEFFVKKAEEKLKKILNR